MRTSRLRPLVAAAALLVTAPALPGLPSGLPGSTAEAASPVTARPLGHDRIGVRRGDTWLLRDALDGGAARTWREGPSGAVPVAGDLDGDGSAAVSLFAGGTWTLRDTERGPARTVRFGQAGDQPVVGDWDGDGTDTLGVFRAGTWLLRNGPDAVTSTRVFVFGRPGDVAVVGDWNGDGRDDVGVRRGTRWLQRDSASAGPSTRSFESGAAGDLPVAGDWDHDGRDTPGTFRDGTWTFLRDNAAGPVQTTRFGGRGDRPVVRRTAVLAPGVTHRVVRDGAAPWVAHVATVQLSAASSPETVLAGDRLRGTEHLGSMVRRSGAVLGVNGDFFLGSGRPVHLYANDGRLVQSPTQRGRAFALVDDGNRFAMGFPDVRHTVTATRQDGRQASYGVDRTNLGAPAGQHAAAYDAAAAGLEAPPDGQCYVGLAPSGSRSTSGGRVLTPLTTTHAPCGGSPPGVPARGVLLAARPGGAAAGTMRSLPRGTRATTSAQLGFPGALDALGGNPLLLVDGKVPPGNVDGKGAFYERHPRTAVGATDDGRLLLVVVDGRQPGHSRGMTLRELAGLMQRLGARQALNLDGGGSTAMVVNGLLVNRPSDGRARPVGNALVVLPGADPGEADLRRKPASSAPAPEPPGGPLGLPLDPPLDLPPLDVPPLQLPPPLGDVLPLSPAVTDPAGAGGLADALLRSGQPVSDELRRAAALLRGAP